MWVKFCYSLQPALDGAIRHERHSGIALVGLRADLNRQLAALESLAACERSLHAGVSFKSDAIPGPSLAGDVIARDLCLQALVMRRRCRLTALQAVHDRLATAGERHREAANRRRTLERLRKRRYASFAAELERREANELDEANALRHEARHAAARNYAS